MTKSIVLFGLSANPPTGLGGHMGIIKYFSTLFDEIWILPVYRHAYNSKRQLEPYENRTEMIALSLKDCGLNTSNVHIKTYEKDCFYELFPNSNVASQSISFGSIDLIRWLKSKFPDVHFSMIVGEDAFNDICANKWKESEQLRQMVHFEVLKRKGTETVEINTEHTWFTFHTDIELEEISSTYPYANQTYILP